MPNGIQGEGRATSLWGADPRKGNAPGSRAGLVSWTAPKRGPGPLPELRVIAALPRPLAHLRDSTPRESC